MSLSQRKRESAENHVRKLLEIMGIDVEADDTRETPARIVRMYEEMTSRMRQPEPPFKFTTFKSRGETDTRYDQLVIVNAMRFSSLCAHHHLPFFGLVNIGYLPSDRVCGLSKLPRLVNWCAAQPQMQEELTVSIADELEHRLHPRAAFVVVRAIHTCMRCRGAHDPSSETVTSAVRGKLANGLVRQEFFNLTDLKVRI